MNDEDIRLTISLGFIFFITGITAIAAWWNEWQRRPVKTTVKEEPTESWCQFCEDIKPTKDFGLDPTGRWACLDCRKAAGFVPEEKEPETPEPDLGCQLCGTPTPYLYCTTCQAHGRALREWDKKKRKAEEAIKYNILKVQRYSGRHINLDDVPARATVNVNGGDCSVTVAGNVGEYAEIDATGGSAEIRIQGDVGKGAIIKASGGSAKIYINGYIHEKAVIRASGGSSRVYYRFARSNASIMASGGNSEVIQSTKKKVC